jgi:predicted O-linked N-acetylglucosamine transferase (SPINDLY family)
MSRLAPVQCVTWGHSDTSGVETLDYFMSSDLYEDDAAKDHYSEKLIRLKNCLCTYYYPPYIFSVPQYAIKNQLGLPDDKNVYLCAQNIIKIHPMFDNFVQKILDKDPKGIFVTIDLGKCGADGEIFLKRMKKFGDRHMSVPGKTGIGWVSLLYRSDCLLDCYPFGGCNTSFDSFRIGKGIITLPGPMINGRFTLGMYRKMGIMDLVAKDMNDYVELAYKYANDKVFRDGVEDKINEKCMSIYCEQNSIDRWSDFLQNAVKLPMTPGEISA